MLYGDISVTVTVWGVIHIGIGSNTVKGVLVEGSVSMPPFPCDEIGSIAPPVRPRDARDTP